MIDSAGPAEERTSVARTGAAPDEPAGSGAQGPRRPSPARRILRVALYLLYLVVLLEVGSRWYWKLEYDLPFFAGRRDWCSLFYKEELNESKVWEADLRRENARFDIVFLGGSVMYHFDRYFGRHQGAIQEWLGKVAETEVRTFSLAFFSMTTRDSLTKYRLMGEYDRHFDLVVVCHGINDARMNNCPPARFRDDYTHAAFYKKIERMEAHAWLLPFFRLPYTIEHTVINFLDSSRFETYLPSGEFSPAGDEFNPAWTSYGTDIKTEGPFRENLKGIIQLARARGEPVMLMTFAWYIPEDYARRESATGKLGFGGEDRTNPIGTWGTVEAVRKGLEVHNRVIRELAAANKDVLFVDVEALIPKERANFRDVCHLTGQGHALLFEAIATEIERFLRERKQGRVPVPAGPSR